MTAAAVQVNVLEINVEKRDFLIFWVSLFAFLQNTSAASAPVISAI